MQIQPMCHGMERGWRGMMQLGYICIPGREQFPKLSRRGMLGDPPKPHHAGMLGDPPKPHHAGTQQSPDSKL